MFLLLKMVILVKRENLIKATRSYEYIVSLFFKDKMQVPITLLLFWQFVCNLKIPLRNSVITPFKVLNISVAGCRIFWSWIETEPLNKSILLSI